MSKVSDLNNQTTITDNLIFLSVYNSKNVKVPSYKLINFLSNGLEISKSRPFLSPGDFVNNKILLSSKTNRIYVTNLSPSDISYNISSKNTFETELENLNLILKGDYAINRNNIINYINSENEITSNANDCLKLSTIAASALKNIFNTNISGGENSVAAFNKEGNNYVLTNVNLDKNVHKKYFIAKNKSEIALAMETMGAISSSINEEMIEIQKKITQKLYDEKKEFYPWKLEDDARSNPAEHLKFIIRKLKAKGLTLKFTEEDIDKSVDNLDDETVSESLSINLAEVIVDIRYKIASSNLFINSTASKPYYFKKIYDLYSAGHEVYNVMKNYFNIDISSAPKWDGDYTYYLDYTKCNTWQTVNNINNLLNLDDTNFIDYKTMFT